MIRRTLITAALGLFVAAALSGCSSPVLTLVPGLSDSPPDPAAGISGSSFAMTGNVYSLEMDTFLCSLRDVHIVDLQLYRPTGGVQLARWGIENDHITMNANLEGPLTRLGAFTSHDITRRCHASPDYARIGLELHRTRPGAASFLGLRITYDSVGGQKTAYLAEQIRIRDPRTAD